MNDTFAFFAAMKGALLIRTLALAAPRTNTQVSIRPWTARGENYGLDQVEIEAVNAPALEEGAEPIHKIVSRDGKKKGVKVSGNWKDPSIKVKWLDAEGKGFGETVSVKTQNYDRKKW